MITLRQIRSFIAVFEEGSFTRAAARENATQSGLSQHVSAMETALGARLFERRGGGVEPTSQGRLYYRRTIEALRSLETGETELRRSLGAVSGSVRAGLMPTFTRAVLPPVLEEFVESHPQIEIEVIEGYSGALSEMVRAGELDFALVPAANETAGLSVTRLMSNPEMLLARAGGGEGAAPAHMAPVRLADLGALRLVLPGATNVRNARLKRYLTTNGVAVGRLLEMDSMFATLGLVARSDWVTILPALICVADADGGVRRVHPIMDPPLESEFVVIEPSRRPLAPAARLFLDVMRGHLERLSGFGTAPR